MAQAFPVPSTATTVYLSFDTRCLTGHDAALYVQFGQGTISSTGEV